MFFRTSHVRSNFAYLFALWFELLIPNLNVARWISFEWYIRILVKSTKNHCSLHSDVKCSYFMYSTNTYATATTDYDPVINPEI